MPYSPSTKRNAPASSRSVGCAVMREATLLQEIVARLRLQ